MSKSKPLSYEAALEKLEAIIQRVEDGEIGLEEALASAEQGMELIHHCRDILDRAKGRIEELMADLPTSSAREAAAQSADEPEDELDVDEDEPHDEEAPF
ncbi:MAG: exodeoxyribonuclease VII small subunit [Phycisphaeraceae bacterium]|nr:exodeoxyribonuclease VII small subunit [Phycisphaeraceae bacterium]